ncbi:MAG: GHKL domain-containing protein [Bacillota bacterium]|nr:GHKL domain-containing protein [Bacillota bacterium]
MSLTSLLHDLVRSSVTTTMLVILLFTLAQPKFGKKTQIATMITIVAIDLVANLYFYMTRDYTTLSKFDILYFVIVSICVKPLFKENIMQWLFNCITAMNVYAIAVVISYYLCDLFPYPYYAITFLRFIIFGTIILFFWKDLRPLYIKISEQWNVYLLLVTGVFINIIWYFVSAHDVVTMLKEQMVPLILLVFLAIFVYFSIFYSLKNQLHENSLMNKNIKMQKDKEILEISTEAMEKKLLVMDEAVRQMSIVQHDRRHFNNTMLELLHQDKASEAMALLERQNKTFTASPARYCENAAAGAVVSYYAGLCERARVDFTAKLDIPVEPGVGSLELAMVMANLLENAIHACEKQSYNERRFIGMTAVFTGRILLQVENSYTGEVVFDQNGYPTSEEDGHGTGTKSILAFVEKQNGAIEYTAENDIFRVRVQI